MNLNENPTPLLVVDIDGTVRQGKTEMGKWCNTPADVMVMPEAVTMMVRWKRAGGRVMGASNQGGIALGFLPADLVAETMDETIRQVNKIALDEHGFGGGVFDRFRWCPHHQDAEDPMQAACWCRKPSPGMVIEEAYSLGQEHHEIYPPSMGLFVGDLPPDQNCARILRMPFQWADFWRAQAGNDRPVLADWRPPHLRLEGE